MGLKEKAVPLSSSSLLELFIYQDSRISYGYSSPIQIANFTWIAAAFVLVKGMALTTIIGGNLNGG